MFLFVYRIGVAEKGSMSLELKVDSSVGHSSMPPKETSIGILCNAIARYVIRGVARGGGAVAPPII